MTHLLHPCHCAHMSVAKKTSGRTTQQDATYPGPEKLIGADDPRHALQENGGPADRWYLDDGDILCHPILYCPAYKHSTRPTLKLRQSANNRKQKLPTTSQTWTHPPDWKIKDVRPLAFLLPQQSTEMSQDPAGKGKGGQWQARRAFEGYCIHCWKWGHMEKDCFTLAKTKAKGGKGKKCRQS